jgi:hypothetical protein
VKRLLGEEKGVWERRNEKEQDMLIIRGVGRIGNGRSKRKERKSIV